MLLRLKKKSEKEIPVQKIYHSFGEALAACNDNGYGSEALCKLVAFKTNRYKEAINQQPYNINAVQCYLTITLQNILLKNGSKEISITDFGGACGAHYFETRRLIDDAVKLKWTVIETAAMVKQAIACKLENHELHFVTDLHQSFADLLYFSSSIQYVPNPYDVLKAAIATGFPFILFNRMMLNKASNEDLITVQQSMLSANGPGKMTEDIQDRLVYYPHTAMSEKKFLAVFENEYELVFRFDETSGNIHQSDEKFIGGGFLFKKIGTNLKG